LFAENRDEIVKRMREAAVRAGRDPMSVKLCSVSKTFPNESIIEAYEAGERVFGENRMPEARNKAIELGNLEGIEFHFIGHLQTNKMRYLKNHFALIHSLDSAKLAEEMNEYFKKNNHVQNVLVQVNIAKDMDKHGIFVEDLKDFFETLKSYTNLNIKGFSMMPPLVDDVEENRVHFRGMKKIFDEYRAAYEDADNINIEELSMGMSGDFEIAVEEGATIIRVGTALFGKRTR